MKKLDTFQVIIATTVAIIKVIIKTSILMDQILGLQIF
jgi:hypothetical protein